MKKLFLIAGVLFGFSLNAMAGDGYCNSRQTNRDIQHCYKNAIEVHAEQIKKNYQRLMQSPKLSAQQKRQLGQDQKEWVASLDSRCLGDMRCYLEVVKQHNYFFYGQVRKL